MTERIRRLTAGARGDAAGLTGYGLAGLLAWWLWFPYLWLLIAGAAVAAVGAASLTAVLSHGRAWHDQDVLQRRLFAAVKRIPSGYVLTDPQTGELITAERERGWLTLAVTDAPAPGSVAAVARYMVGSWGAPVPPSHLYRHLGALDDVPPARWRWQQRSALEHFSAQTGAAEVTTGEIAGLLDQVNRATLAG